jgi:choline dehydrogenase-like flavoprotein
MSSSSTNDIDRSPSERVDVCIVGAGVAGALVAHSLAKNGHEVVLLEAGKRFDRGDRLQRMERDIRPEHDGRSVCDMDDERDRYTSSGELFYPLNQSRVKGVGGTTLHWMGIVSRLHEKDFEMRSRYGVASDWPISYADLRPYYATAEEELGVAGRAADEFTPPRENEYPMAAFPHSYSDTLFIEVCKKLGIETRPVSQARNSEQYDGRSPCLGYSTCIKVCPSGAKYSGDVHVRKAEENGVRVIDRAPVQYLEHDADGSHIEAAVYATPDGDTYRQSARQFVVACGAVETARLLLLSDSETYPDGLANSSGLVGRYFMEHPTVGTSGRLDRPTNQNPIGFQTMESQQFYEHDDPPPGSFLLTFENVDPTSPVDMALSGGDPGTFEADLMDTAVGEEWGNALFETMQDNYREDGVGLSAIAEPLPRKENTVTLDRTKRDDHGNPVPEISWNLGAYERETMERALNVHRKILNEMNGKITGIQEPDNPGQASHHMGTTRMGDDPAESVVDSRLRTHDVRNLTIASGSVFVTAGASPPTLTIAALSLKAAEHIDDSLRS